MTLEQFGDMQVLVEQTEDPSELIQQIEAEYDNRDAKEFFRVLHLVLCEAAKLQRLSLVKEILRLEKYQYFKTDEKALSKLPSPLWEAISVGNDSIINELMLNGPDPTLKSMMACESRNASMIWGKANPIDVAVFYKKDIVVKILDQLPEWDQCAQRLYPLHHACQYADSDFLLKMLKSERVQNDLNMGNGSMQTPIMIALLHQPSLIVELLDAGADLTGSDSLQGLTILHQLCSYLSSGRYKGKPQEHTWEAIMKALVAKGADLDRKSNLGHTPLSLICEPMTFQPVKWSAPEADEILSITKYIASASNKSLHSSAMLSVVHHLGDIIFSCLPSLSVVRRPLYRLRNVQIFDAAGIQDSLPAMKLCMEQHKVLLSFGADPHYQNENGAIQFLVNTLIQSSKSLSETDLLNDDDFLWGYQNIVDIIYEMYASYIKFGYSVDLLCPQLFELMSRSVDQFTVFLDTYLCTLNHNDYYRCLQFLVHKTSTSPESGVMKQLRQVLETRLKIVHTIKHMTKMQIILSLGGRNIFLNKVDLLPLPPALIEYLKEINPDCFTQTSLVE